MDATGWIDLVLARASELRKAGVLSIGIGGCTATLEPLPPFSGVEADKPSASVDELTDPLHDPHSYPGGVVPGFEITKFPVLEE